MMIHSQKKKTNSFNKLKKWDYVMFMFKRDHDKKNEFKLYFIEIIDIKVVSWNFVMKFT